MIKAAAQKYIFFVLQIYLQDIAGGKIPKIMVEL